MTMFTVKVSEYVPTDPVGETFPEPSTQNSELYV